MPRRILLCLKRVFHVTPCFVLLPLIVSLGKLSADALDRTKADLNAEIQIELPGSMDEEVYFPIGDWTISVDYPDEELKLLNELRELRNESARTQAEIEYQSSLSDQVKGRQVEADTDEPQVLTE